MIEITVVNTANPPLHLLKALLQEYLTWGNTQFNQRYHFNFGVESMVEADLRNLHRYSMEYGGRLLLASLDGKPVGMIGLQKIGKGLGEIRRLYVRPQGRGHGIARKMMNKMIATASELGYSRLRLETTPFMREAQALYRSVGFREIAPYAETHMPQEVWPYMLFMELEMKPQAAPFYGVTGDVFSDSAIDNESLEHWMYGKEGPQHITRFYHL